VTPPANPQVDVTIAATVDERRLLRDLAAIAALANGESRG
jgi:hypothetical protein